MERAYMLDVSKHGPYYGYFSGLIEYNPLIYAWFIMYLAKLS